MKNNIYNKMFEFKIILQHECKHINNALVNINNCNGLFTSYHHLNLNPLKQKQYHTIQCPYKRSTIWPSKSEPHFSFKIQNIMKRHF